MRGRQGFTLLELTIAMTFVALLVSGIVISISTCLHVWRWAIQSADVNQEARAVLEIISRDLRGAYSGLTGDAGFFVGTPARLGEPSFDTLELSTGSGSLSRLALLPERDEPGSEWSLPTTSDVLGVRYQWQSGGADLPEGLYRTAWAAPLSTVRSVESYQSELISHALTSLQFRYFDGEQWLTSYDARYRASRPPAAVLVALTLLDERHREHEFESVIPIAVR